MHFISGLPRWGSTLLAGILKQNPRFADYANRRADWGQLMDEIETWSRTMKPAYRLRPIAACARQ